MKYVFYFIFGLVILSSLDQINYNLKELNSKFKRDTILIVPKFNFDSLYKCVVDNIKIHEGFSDSIYFCPGGHKTIGYGHTIKNGEDITYLNEKDADKLLKSDFNKAIKIVNSTTNLKDNQLLAISHFVYCLGQGNFEKSTLKKKIKKGESIKEEILKWCKINGKSNNNLLKQRNFELNLYTLN